VRKNSLGGALKIWLKNLGALKKNYIVYYCYKLW